MKLPRTDILLVDDREDGLTALEACLAGAGQAETSYNLVKAGSGREALSLLDDHEFAVILLDVQMPGMDGFETAAEVKRDPRHRDTPILFVTAINKDDAYIYKGYKQGAVDYIFKPFDPNILRSKVAVFVDLFLKTRQLELQTRQIQESERRERYLRLAELEVESLKRYRNLADSIPHLVWRARADGSMDYVNRVWCSYTGLSPEQSSGMGWEVSVEQADLRVLLKTWINAMEDGTDFQVECRIRGADGEFRWHWFRAVPEKRASGEISSWLGTCTEIHERKLIEERLQIARREADSANAAKTNFLANMSHEIRTPLNAIMGFAELLQNSTLASDENVQNAATIRRNGQQLLKIIDEILDISKVEAGRLDIEQLPFDLHAMFVDISSLLSMQAGEKGLVLKMVCETALPVQIVSDPTRLRQILINIVGNAIKFTAQGGVSLKIGWQPEFGVPTHGQLSIGVIDTGVGIDAASAERLFHPFSQVDASTTRLYGGTGLGLALSRRLAKALGGDVALMQSSRDRGSEFCITIAADRLDESGWFDTVEETRAVPTEKMRNDTKPLSDIKVLVIDDALDNRTLLSRFLIGAGATVTLAATGEEGCQKAMAEDFEVVLMDIQMPTLDGYAATARLRDGGYKRPILALTAHALKEERERSLQAGCDDHLTKPIDRRTLIHQVARFAGRDL